MLYIFQRWLLLIDMRKESNRKKMVFIYFRPTNRINDNNVNEVDGCFRYRLKINSMKCWYVGTKKMLFCSFKNNAH